MSCIQSFNSHNADVMYDKPPDGGYGWFIVAGHFINIGIGYGFTKSFGIFFPYIKETFDCDNTTTSGIFSMMLFFQYSGSIVGNILYRQFGPRITLWLGGVFCTLGLLIPGLLQTLFALYVGVGFFVGLGFSFIILVGSATLSRFFKLKRPMAIAFAMTGVPIMSITFPILFEFVYETFGLYGGICVIAGLEFQICLGATFFRPIKLKSDGLCTEDTMMVELLKASKRLLKNPNFLLYSTAISLVISGKFMVNPFVKDFAVHNIGLEKYEPALILSICSGIDIVSRPVGGRLCSTKFIRETVGTFETFAMAVSGLGFVSLFAPFYISSFATFAVYGIMFGLFFGLTIGVEWSNVAELVETDILSDAITFVQLETSIGVLIAPLLGGYISDKTGDYSYVFYIAGILLLSGSICAAIVAVRVRCSCGEQNIETDEHTRDDGFDKPVLESTRSVLGISISSNLRKRGPRDLAEEEKIMKITDSVVSLHA